MTPTVTRPRSASQPPNPAIIAMVNVLIVVNIGPKAAVIISALTPASRLAALTVVNSAIVSGARAKACTTRTAPMFSSVTALSAPRLSCTARKACRLRRAMAAEIAIISGKMNTVPNASCQLRANMAIIIPTVVSMLVVNWISPSDSTRLMTSVSLERRLIKSPTSWSS